jgi:hypothetical protein
MHLKVGAIVSFLGKEKKGKGWKIDLEKIQIDS